MRKSIQSLIEKLNAHAAEHDAIESELQKEYNKLFADCGHLQAAIKAVENSSEYSQNRLGEIVSWIRYPELSAFKDCSRYLAEYLREYHFIDADFENACLMFSQGRNLIINDDGDVYDEDSGKWIISKSDYATPAGRNLLIEQWMESTGYYPGVFRVDRHGNVFHINTQEKE